MIWILFYMLTGAIVYALYLKIIPGFWDLFLQALELKNPDVFDFSDPRDVRLVRIVVKLAFVFSWPIMVAVVYKILSGK